LLVDRLATPEDIEKIRAGRYRELYGEDWEKDFVRVFGPDWRSLSTKQRAALRRAEERRLRKEAKESDAYVTPFIEGTVPAYIGKKEFARMIVTRLRDSELNDTAFVTLAQMYMSVRGWKLKPGKKEQPPEPETDFNEKIRELEARES
jgi:hypothetical protein